MMWDRVKEHMQDYYFAYLAGLATVIMIGYLSISKSCRAEREQEAIESCVRCCSATYFQYQICKDRAGINGNGNDGVMILPQVYGR